RDPTVQECERRFGECHPFGEPVGLGEPNELGVAVHFPEVLHIPAEYISGVADAREVTRGSRHPGYGVRAPVERIARYANRRPERVPLTAQNALGFRDDDAGVAKQPRVASSEMDRRVAGSRALAKRSRDGRQRCRSIRLHEPGTLQIENRERIVTAAPLARGREALDSLPQ